MRGRVTQQLSLLRRRAAVLVTAQDAPVTEVVHVRVPAARQKAHSVIRRLASLAALSYTTARGSEGKEDQMSHHLKTEKKAAPKKSAKKAAKKKK
jgi:hypothetical protein